MRKRIVTWMIDSGSIDEKERELYEYAIQSLKLLIMPVFYAVLMGWILQEWRITALFVFIFALVRKFSGGYHAKTELRCTFFSLLSIFAGVESVRMIMPGLGLRIAFFISVLIILMFSPLDSPNKRIDRNEKKYICKIVIFIEAIMCVIVWAIENSKYENYMKSIMVANIFVALFQVVQIIINILQKSSFYACVVEKTDQ